MSLTKEENYQLYLQAKEASSVEEKEKIWWKQILGNESLVYSSAKAFIIKKDYKDFIQEGKVGLMEGTKRYKGTSAYSTYVTWWIRAYMFKFIKSMNLIRLPSSGKNTELFWKLSKITEALESSNIENVEAEIAKMSGVSEFDVAKLQSYKRMTEYSLSLDHSTSESITLHSARGDAFDSNVIIAELSKRSSVSPEDKFLKAELSANIAKFAETLSIKEKSIFTKRFLESEQTTLEDIGQDLGLTKARIQQIEVSLKDRIKKQVKNWGYAVAG